MLKHIDAFIKKAMELSFGRPVQRTRHDKDERKRAKRYAKGYNKKREMERRSRHN